MVVDVFEHAVDLASKRLGALIESRPSVNVIVACRIVLSDPGIVTDDALSALLHESFGFSTFRPGQLNIIRAVIAGISTLGIIPTAGGKSLPFVLAVLLIHRVLQRTRFVETHRFAYIVVTPLVALARDHIARLPSSVIGVMFGGTLPRVDPACDRPTVLFTSPENIPSLCMALTRDPSGGKTAGAGSADARAPRRLLPPVAPLASVPPVAPSRPSPSHASPSTAPTPTAAPFAARSLASRLQAGGAHLAALADGPNPHDTSPHPHPTTAPATTATAADVPTRGTAVVPLPPRSSPSLAWAVPVVVVDEAHCVSAWGSTFRPLYLTVPLLRQLPGPPVCLALTATALPSDYAVIRRVLRTRRDIVVQHQRDNLTLSLSNVSRYLDTACLTFHDNDKSNDVSTPCVIRDNALSDGGPTARVGGAASTESEKAAIDTPAVDPDALDKEALAAATYVAVRTGSDVGHAARAGSQARAAAVVAVLSTPQWRALRSIIIYVQRRQDAPFLAAEILRRYDEVAYTGADGRVTHAQKTARRKAPAAAASAAKRAKAPDDDTPAPRAARRGSAAGRQATGGGRPQPAAKTKTAAASKKPAPKVRPAPRRAKRQAESSSDATTTSGSDSDTSDSESDASEDSRMRGPARRTVRDGDETSAARDHHADDDSSTYDGPVFIHPAIKLLPSKRRRPAQRPDPSPPSTMPAAPAPGSRSARVRAGAAAWAASREPPHDPLLDNYIPADVLDELDALQADGDGDGDGAVGVGVKTDGDSVVLGGAPDGAVTDPMALAPSAVVKSEESAPVDGGDVGVGGTEVNTDGDGPAGDKAGDAPNPNGPPRRRGNPRRAPAAKRATTRPSPAAEAAPSASVFIQQQDPDGADELDLDADGGGAVVSSYHAGLSSSARQTIERLFRNGTIRILVSTVAFGMGVDLPSVDGVLHAALPGSVADYVQETGRAGRDGRASLCRAIFDVSDYHAAASRAFELAVDPDAFTPLIAAIAGRQPHVLPPADCAACVAAATAARARAGAARPSAPSHADAAAAAAAAARRIADLSSDRYVDQPFSSAGDGLWTFAPADLGRDSDLPDGVLRAALNLLLGPSIADRPLAGAAASPRAGGAGAAVSTGAAAGPGAPATEDVGDLVAACSGALEMLRVRFIGRIPARLRVEVDTDQAARLTRGDLSAPSLDTDLPASWGARSRAKGQRAQGHGGGGTRVGDVDDPRLIVRFGMHETVMAYIRNVLLSRAHATRHQRRRWLDLDAVDVLRSARMGWRDVSGILDACVALRIINRYVPVGELVVMGQLAPPGCQHDDRGADPAGGKAVGHNAIMGGDATAAVSRGTAAWSATGAAAAAAAAVAAYDDVEVAADAAAYAAFGLRPRATVASVSSRLAAGHAARVREMSAAAGDMARLATGADAIAALWGDSVASGWVHAAVMRYLDPDDQATRRVAGAAAPLQSPKVSLQALRADPALFRSVPLPTVRMDPSIIGARIVDLFERFPHIQWTPVAVARALHGHMSPRLKDSVLRQHFMWGAHADIPFEALRRVAAAELERWLQFREV